MKTAIDIVQSVLLPKLEKDASFDADKTNIAFWESLATELLDFEKDTKPVYSIIFSLELADSEKVITKLPVVYSTYIKELAENYVLKQTSKATDYLLESNNETFLKEVDFLQTMQKAIKSVERKRIKRDLPNSYERLTFELSENDLANVTKKKGREDLKAKFKQWDAELVTDEVPVIQMSEETTYWASAIISLSWMKYAVAACVIIAAGLFYFKSSESGLVPEQNSVVTAPDKKENEKVIEKPEIISPTKEVIALAEIETTSKTIPVLELDLYGYTANNKKLKITVNFKDVTNRIQSLEKIIGNESKKHNIDSKTKEAYQNELVLLKTQTGKYLFDGKTVTLFQKTTKDCKVLLTEEKQYYFQNGETYYRLNETSTPLSLIKETDGTIIDTLNKINFEND
ncbi:hypothetical protein [Flavobacterium sp.]|uniref:hypothetical protein n=1 Tax=Flavobacterium sp. TaxID=239 RepID=UPI002D13C242|nr:hypothetical protein [Flavobacterium sp.]HSD07661.1 hypothetical protein [Flavobacterium sp.]